MRRLLDVARQYRPHRLVTLADAHVPASAFQHDLDSLPLSLRVVLRASTAGVVASVVLFGHTSETQLAFYALMGVSLSVYVLARGEELVGSLFDYLTSRKVLWRWAFVVWAILSLLWTTRGRVSVDRAITLVELQIVGLVFFDAARNMGLARWILNTVFVSVVVAACHAMITEDPNLVTRMSGLYASPNTLGMYCVVGMAVFVAAGGQKRRPAGALLYIPAFVLLMGIVASSSLKGLLGLVLVCILGAAISASRTRTLTFVAVSSGLVALLVALVEPLRMIWDHAIYRAEVATIGTSVGVNQSTVERARFIKKGLVLIAESPIVGRGLDTFRWLSGEGTYAHNNLVELGVALGLIGVVAYYGFHVSILATATRRRLTGDFVWRFIAITVPTLLLLDMAVVSYASKLSTLLLIMCAGWLERTCGDGAPALLEGEVP